MNDINTARRRMCTLIITHRCNLNCTYCYEKFKNNQTMTLETAKEIIRKEFEFTEKSPDFDEIEFDFMGGEPFTEFNLMREIMEWTWSREWNVPYLFFTTTNATLIDDNIKQWLQCHRNRFFVGISYDGTPKMQDENRSKCAQKVDLDFFLETYPMQPVKMTVSRQSVRYLAEGVIYLHSKGCKISANCGYGMDWSDEEKAEYQWQLLKLADFYLEHPEIEPTSFFDRKLRFVLNKEEKLKKWCGTGTSMITYDVDKKTYPCHLFTPLVLGSDRAAELQRKMDFASEKAMVSEKCRRCSLINICPTCYGFNYLGTGNVAQRDRHMCDLFRIQVKVYAYYIDELVRRQLQSKKTISAELAKEAEAVVYLKKHNPENL